MGGCGGHTPVIPAPERQKNLEFEASLGCTVRLCLRKPNVKATTRWRSPLMEFERIS